MDTASVSSASDLLRQEIITQNRLVISDSLHRTSVDTKSFIKFLQKEILRISVDMSDQDTTAITIDKQLFTDKYSVGAQTALEFYIENLKSAQSGISSLQDVVVKQEKDLRQMLQS